MSLEDKSSNGKGYNFGTFQGVYTPSILTILGVIMYLRFGWVLGNVGLGFTLLIVTLSTAITFMTGLALCSLATNMQVGGGGAYFIISRSLGIECGAAVGLPLFFAQAFGISFYLAGFSESISGVFPFLPQKFVSVAALIVLAGLAYKSANLALKSQYFILVAIVLSLVSFFMGSPPSPSISGTATGVIDKLPFWTVFAVFFPAVTGIEAGIAMSGDLKNPSKSLPIGTVAAIVSGYIIYLLIPIFLSRKVDDPTALITNSLIMVDIARWKSLVLIGIWGASLSSAMGSLLGAPRTLQALGQDRVIPRFVSKTFGKNNDPRIATLISFSVALVGILLGDLNIIAPVLSMFFLTSYGLLNLSSGLEALLEPPSWRPKFQVSWKLNLLGAFACFVAMYMISPGATLAALTISASVYYLMKRRSLLANWGDIRYGILTLAARQIIQKLLEYPVTPRTWKPNILVLSGAPTTRWHLIELAQAISRNQTFVTVAAVIQGERFSPDRLSQLKSAIDDYLEKREVKALVKVTASTDIYSGLESLVRGYGFGPLQPNTVFLGEAQQEENISGFVRLIDLTCRMRKNLVIVREGDEPPQSMENPQIDVWWSRKSKNAGLMLALAFQLRKSKIWKKCPLMIKTIVKSGNGEKDAVEKYLTEFVETQRIDAEVAVIEADDQNPFHEISKSSANSSLVFIGLRPPNDNETLGEYSEYYSRLLDNAKTLPSTVFVYAAEDLNFRSIFSFQD